jgi:hypothetical protein
MIVPPPLPFAMASFQSCLRPTFLGQRDPQLCLSILLAVAVHSEPKRGQSQLQVFESESFFKTIDDDARETTPCAWLKTLLPNQPRT